MEQILRRVVCASELSSDPEMASWIFESSAVDDNDPLSILLQREAEAEDDDWYAHVLNPIRLS